MKKANNKTWIRYAAAFLIPAVIIILVMIVLKINPFGNISVLLWDARLQHKDYYGYLWDLLHGQASIEYSFGKSLGGRMLGLIGFYISSPLNLLLYFFKKEQIAAFMSVMIVLRIGLCGVTSHLYLKKRFSLAEFPAMLLSTAYALMEYNVYYCRNVMWLDGVMMLPLIALGIYELIYNRKKVLLFVNVALAIISNWYTGYMVCLMSILYFIYEYLIYTDFKLFKTLKSKGKVILNYIFTMFLAVFASMAVLLPALISLIGGKATNNTSALTGVVHFDILHFFSAFDINAAVNKQSAPVIFCGGIVLLCSIYYFFDNNVKIKEKILTGCFSLFLILSFCLQDLEHLWTAFVHSSSYYFRFSFIVPFLMIVISAKTWNSIKENGIKKKNMIASVISVFLIFWILYRGGELVSSKKMLLIYLVCIVITGSCIVLCLHKNIWLRRVAMVVMSAILCIELTYNAYSAFDDYSDSSSLLETYNSQMDAVISELDSIEEDNFYRFEKNVSYLTLSINSKVATCESLFFGYNSIEHYSSAYDLAVDTFLAEVGYSDSVSDDVFLCETYWNSSMLLMDSLLSIKYAVMENETYGWVSAALTSVLPFEDMDVYQNSYSLPLGYNVSADMGDIEFGDDPYENQELLVSAMTGEDSDIYEDLQADSVVSEGSEEVITLTAAFDGPVYLYLDSAQTHSNLYSDNCEIYVNGEFLQKCCSRFVMNSMLLGDYSAGDTIEITIVHNNSETEQHVFYAVQLNCEEFERVINELSSGYESALTAEGNTISGTYVTDEDTTVFLSVACEESWTAYVDGKKVEIRKLANTFIGIDLTAGEHEIYLVYHTPGLAAGLVLSGVGIAAFAVWMVFIRKRRKNG